ncbi:hypothetical protein ACWC9Q_17605 [Streptomyces sp. NPDC001142]
MAAPDSERESRPETDRRDVDERDEDREEERDEERDAAREPSLPRLPRLPELPGPCAPPPASPVGGELTMPVGETTGARPQVSQYSSPPPTSS